MSSFGSSFRREQLFSLMKNVKTRNTTRLTNERLELRNESRKQN
jgi:hypothetical protein